MSESIHDYVVDRLRPMKRQEVLQLAENTGISESTIRKIKYGHVKDPGVSLIERLNKYFRDRPPA